MRKEYSVFVTCLVIMFCFSVRARATDFYMTVDGNQYTNGQTAYVRCDKHGIGCSLYSSNPGVYTNDAPTTWDKSSNFSIINSDVQSIITLNLASDDGDGFVTLHSSINGGINITVYIKQKPPIPTFTATPNLCTPSSTATYSVSSSYAFQSVKPMYFIWQTTGGITVNNSNSYTSPNGVTSSVTIQYNSYGTISVRGYIASCSLSGDATPAKYIGLPSSSNITFNVYPGPDPGSLLCSYKSYYYQASPNLPVSQYTYNWSIPSGSSYVASSYFSGGTATIEPGAPGGSYTIQMNVTNIACNSSVSTSRLFNTHSCSGGGLRVANNPATNTLTAQFDNTNEVQYLPDVLRLVDETNDVFKEVKVKGQYSDQEVKKGLSIDFDVRSLPRGIYYLQGIYNSEKSESIRVILQ